MNFFNRLSQRDQILVVVGSISLAVIVVYFLILMPQFGRLGDLNKKEETLNNQLEEAKLNLTRLKSIQAEAAQTEAKLISLAQRLPDDAEIPALVVELQNVANSSGLAFNSAKIGDVVDQSGFAEIPFTVTASGTFYSLIDYLYRIENLQRKMVITSVSVTGNEKSYPDLTVEIKLNAYKLSSQETQLPPPAGGAPPPTGQSQGQ